MFSVEPSWSEPLLRSIWLEGFSVSDEFEKPPLKPLNYVQDEGDSLEIGMVHLQYFIVSYFPFTILNLKELPSRMEVFYLGIFVCLLACKYHQFMIKGRHGHYLHEEIVQNVSRMDSFN